MKKVLIALVGACALLTTACGSDGESTVATDCKPVAKVDTVDSGKLTISVAEYPPYIYKDGGSVSGADGELLKLVAERLCLTPDVTQSSFTAIIEGLKSKRADISAGDWTLNDERRSLFEVSDPVYADNQGVISKEGYDTVEQLVGKKVGTASGYLIVPDMQKAFGKSNVKLYQSDVEGYQDLKAGRIDAYVSGQGALGFMLKQGGDTSTKNLTLKPDDRIAATVNPSVAVALVTKGNTGLRDAVNEILAEYRSSGDLAAQLTSDGVDPESAKVE